jgi:16S rRNA (adenine1518-N6/adenine1519-N6)-dimethyltransferase
MEKSDLPPPSKYWGQNYLVNKGIKKKIVDSLDLKDGERVVEIGAGRGGLTKFLVDVEGITIVALEPHPPSYEFLQSMFKDCNIIEIEKIDAIKCNYESFSADKSVGNLPYNAAARILFQLMKSGYKQKCWVLMFQKEMAQRIVSPSGSKTYGSLSVLVQILTKAKLLFNVGPGSFFPAPKVDSSVVLFTPLPHDESFNKDFAKEVLIKIFSLRRKKIKTVLKKLYNSTLSESILDECKIDGDKRPEKIEPDEFKLLISTILKYKG